MKDRIEWTRMVSDCITGYRSAKGDADALPPRTFIRAWMNRNFGLQKIPGRLFRLFYRSDKEELNEAFRAGNRARKQESAADAVQGTDDAGPRGQLTRWAAEIVKAVNEASAKSSIWTADNFGDNIEIADAPGEYYYLHRIKVNSWRGCIDDFDIDFENGYVAGYINIYVPVNPEDGYAFSIGGACNGFDVNESYNTYNTLEEAISGSIEEIIDCIEYWNDEVTERMSDYDDDDIDEAFRACNKARKKESVVDMISDNWDPEEKAKQWYQEFVKALNAASGKKWELEYFPSFPIDPEDYIEIEEDDDYWKYRIDDFNVNFLGGKYDEEWAVAGVSMTVYKNPSDGFEFYLDGAAYGLGLTGIDYPGKRYIVYEEAVKDSIKETIRYFNSWRTEAYNLGNLGEAFKAGNQARKKEAAADAVQGIEYIHYVDDPFLNMQMNRLKAFVKPGDVTHLTGNCIKFYIDVPCDFEFFFKVTISSLDVYTVSVMFNVEGLETWIYNAEDMMDEEDLEKVFDRIIDALYHPAKFEEYREGGYNG